MSDIEIYDPRAVDQLRERQKSYRMAFTAGTPAHAAFVDLGRFCRTFDESVTTGDQALILVGLRRAFMRIWQHLNLDIDDLAAIYGAARRQGE